MEKPITISPELYRIAEMIEQLPKNKRKIVYEMLEKSVDVILKNHQQKWPPENSGR